METGARRLGKYELHERMARGGQGEVWKAFDPVLQRYVALKQLHSDSTSDPDFIKRFMEEGRFIASLRHPNIVQIHDFQIIQTPGSDEISAYMVMDFIEGPTLAHYIHNTSHKGHFPAAADIIYIFTGVSLALDYAHRIGMIHRDIKPANIMLDKRAHTARLIGQPILTDFGIAKLQGSFADKTRIVGTPTYMAPEQGKGLSGDSRSDLYSLGIVLYEILTGVTPFRADSYYALMMKHVSEPPPPPASINPAISPALSEVILKSIAKDPDERFQSASAMTIALARAFNVPVPAELRKPDSSSDVKSIEQLQNPLQPTLLSDLSPLPIATPVKPLPTPSQTPVRRRKGLYIALIALLAILVVGSAVLYGRAVMNHAPTGTTPSASANQVVGHVDFLSSPNAPPGTLDEVQITLQSIPDAPAGETYYAWLEYSNDTSPPVHWALTVHNGSVSSYIDAQHKNLLATKPNLFVITLQNQETIIPDPCKGLYYANISQLKTAFAIMQYSQNSSSSTCSS